MAAYRTEMNARNCVQEIATGPRCMHEIAPRAGGRFRSFITSLHHTQHEATAAPCPCTIHGSPNVPSKTQGRPAMLQIMEEKQHHASRTSSISLWHISTRYGNSQNRNVPAQVATNAHQVPRCLHLLHGCVRAIAPDVLLSLSLVCSHSPHTHTHTQTYKSP